jgi:hypothetical protein
MPSREHGLYFFGHLLHGLLDGIRLGVPKTPCLTRRGSGDAELGPGCRCASGNGGSAAVGLQAGGRRPLSSWAFVELVGRN